MKTKLQRLTVFLLSVLLSAATAGCDSGKPLAVITEGGYEFRGYGTIYGIEQVLVFEGDRQIADLKTDTPVRNEPYSDGDGLNYGMSVADIDGDGHTDVAVRSSRTAGNEKYVVYLGSENGFDYAEKLSGVAGISFADGKIILRTHKRIFYVRGIPNSPDVYDEYDSAVYFGRDEKGSFHEISEERLTYYSDTGMYCFSTYRWDEDTERLESDTDKWIKPEKLEENGFKPFS